MKKFLLAAVMLGLVVADASAFGRRGVFGRRAAPACGGGTANQFSQQTPPRADLGGNVQWKADAQAVAGRCFHPGGGFVAGASYEGVGFSSVSPESALAACCNNGGPVVSQAVARGPGGWYAVKQYAQPGTPVRAFVAGVTQTVGQAVQQTGQVIYNAGTLTLPGRPMCGPNGCR